MNDDPQTAEPRILVVDLETTGLCAARHSILQIGAVWLSGWQGDFSIDCHMWEGAEIEDKALEVNGCSKERCRDQSLISEAEAVLDFLGWMGSQPIMLAGLNPSFDRSFLHAALQRAYGTSKPVLLFPHRVLDLHSLAVSYAIKHGFFVPSRGFYTDEIYVLLDLPPEPKPHTAIRGARREAEALRLLLGLPPMPV